MTSITAINEKYNTDWPKYKAEISEEHRKLLNQFIDRIADVNPMTEDPFLEARLLPWLQVRQFNIDKAEKKFREAIKWRHEFDADNILQWQVPEVLKKYFALGIFGNTKEGCPVVLGHAGNTDSNGIFASCTSEELFKYGMFYSELLHTEMKRCSYVKGQPFVQQCVVIDLENFKLKNTKLAPALKNIKKLANADNDYYPQIPAWTMLINTPKVFMKVYKMVKPLLPSAYHKSVQIFGKTGWQEALREKMDAETYPKYWGGEKVDKDGDPKCPSMVPLGGPVPKEFYLKKKKNGKSTPADEPEDEEDEINIPHAEDDDEFVTSDEIKEEIVDKEK